MLAKSVVFGFLAGIGLTAAVVGGFWLAAPGARETSEPTALEIATLADGSSAIEAEAIAVEETEAIVEDDVAVETAAAPTTDEPPPTTRPTAVPAAPARPTPTPPPAPAPAAPPPAPPSDPEPAQASVPQPQPPVERVQPPLPEPSEPSDVEPIPDVATEDDEADADDAARNNDLGEDDWELDRPVSGTVLNDPEPAESWEPETPTFEDLVISADSVISLQLDTSVSTTTARIEDRVEARTIRDVQVAGETAVPAGSLALASVTLVELGGKIKERAKLGIRFHTLVLADGSEVPIQTETIFREGRSPSKSSSSKIGGAATAGAILGAIFGGKRGAVIGGAAGAAGGTAATMAGDRSPATISAGTSVTVRLQEPATVTIER